MDNTVRNIKEERKGEDGNKRAGYINLEETCGDQEDVSSQGISRLV